ncbi:MAG: glycosyl transferase [Deltaproteobacteria bacterium]|nr:glycosyl transferase [Deltaproteobacteria bacterium]
MYGGTERVVSYLTEELVRQGHDVTLFASGDSETTARLVAPCAHALRLSGCHDAAAHHLVMVEEVVRGARNFDLIHFHIDYLHFPVMRREGLTHVTTLHGRLDLPELDRLYEVFGDMPVVSISDAQRAPLAGAAWQGTVQHGLPRDLYRLGTGQGGYLAFLGRFSPEKRPDLAIEIARRAGLPLRIAAKLDRADRDYYNRHLAPLVCQGHVELVGEIGETDKQAFLGDASALLFPIDWPEPFGMVMIEALACGTPVIAFRRGSVPEVIDDGISGFICEDADEAVRAIERLPELSRARCRERFETRFTSTRMALDYLDIYRRQLEQTHEGREPAGPAGLLDPRHHVARG